ncbi:MAG: hypothetical protein C0609_09480 [Deltaproteobacteria bacterium]|nr:MAG: hypothetical protein C0609_09480 [Deltaproteobacteria bacterium]
MFEAKRRFQRIRTDAEAKISAPIMGGVPERARVGELGLGGCLFYTEEKIGVGRMFMLYLNLNGREVSAVVKVLYDYVNDEGKVCSGAEFLDVEDEDLAVLSGFIDKHVSGSPAFLN